MKTPKCYIDVSFSIEEDFSRFTSEDIAEFIANRELMTEMFKADLLERLDYFSSNIKDLGVTVSFEED